MSDQPRGTARPATILVVDDDADIRALMWKVLSSAGYEVIVAADGKEAIERLRATEAVLVITDLVMPEVEGLETIWRIRTEMPGVKIIAMSGMFGGKFLRPAELLGAHATLSKPFQAQDLLRVISSVLTE